MNLENRVALVTGAASGIGYAYVKNLLQNGVKVALCDINFEGCQSAATEFADVFGVGSTLPLLCDVTDQIQFENAFKSCIDYFKRLDIVVNNAGVLNESMENWDATLNINFGGVVRGTMLAIKHMGKPYGGTGGTVVQTASIAAFMDNLHIAPMYKSTKRAVVEHTRAIGGEISLAHLNVRVMALCPGFVDTSFLQWDRGSGGTRFIVNDFVETMKEIMSKHPIQTPDNVGKGLIEILRRGRTGEIWIVENEEPPRIANIPDFRY